MGIEWVEVLNEDTGKRGRISRGHLENPAIVKPGLLTEVDPDQKPYLPEMFKSRVEEPETEEADEALDEED
jgi:hypothetical protein